MLSLNIYKSESINLIIGAVLPSSKNMPLPNAQFTAQPRISTQPGTQPGSTPTGENILVATASQLSRLVQVHKLSAEAQTQISPDDLARVDTVKQEAIAKIIVLLMAYYKTQGWNPQDIKTSILHMLEPGEGV